MAADLYLPKSSPVQVKIQSRWRATRRQEVCESVLYDLLSFTQGQSRNSVNLGLTGRKRTKSWRGEDRVLEWSRIQERNFQSKINPDSWRVLPKGTRFQWASRLDLKSPECRWHFPNSFQMARSVVIKS